MASVSRLRSAVQPNVPYLLPTSQRAETRVSHGYYLRSTSCPGTCVPSHRYYLRSHCPHPSCTLDARPTPCTKADDFPAVSPQSPQSPPNPVASHRLSERSPPVLRALREHFTTVFHALRELSPPVLRPPRAHSPAELRGHPRISPLPERKASSGWIPPLSPHPHEHSCSPPLADEKCQGSLHDTIRETRPRIFIFDPG